jgi:hypothetical protein
METRYDYHGEVVLLTEPEMYQIVISRFPEGRPQEQMQRVLAVVREGEDLPEVLFAEPDEANHYLIEGLNRLQQGLMKFGPDDAKDAVVRLDMNYEVVEG